MRNGDRYFINNDRGELITSSDSSRTDRGPSSCPSAELIVWHPAAVRRPGRGGSVLGYSDILAATLEQISYFPEFVRGPEVRTFDRVVPGRQEPPDQTPLLDWFTWADLERYTGFVRDFVAAAGDVHAAGRSVDDASAAVAALGEAYPDYMLDDARATVEAIFSELDGSAGR